MIYNARFSRGPDRLLFVVNPSFEYGQLRFTEQDLGGFRQIADSERWGDPFLADPHFEISGSRIELPPLSCGLFLEQG
jgi:hypothetical protein